MPGPVFKLLTTDPESGASTILIHLPPGWHDDELDWHPCAEEGFRLSGWVEIADRHLPVGNHLYRPPGILHGPVRCSPEVGATMIQRFDAPLRILRYTGDEFPHRDLQPITRQHEDWPLEWHERLDTLSLPWEPAPDDGPWAGARYRWLNRHRTSGGGAVQLQLPAGFRGPGSAARDTLEEFVVEGSVTAGGETFVTWGYACRAAGSPAGEYASDEGALLLCWWGADELV